MKRFYLAVLAASALVAAPSAHADITVPVDPQFIQDVRAGQGEPRTNATDEDLMANGLSMCTYVTKKSGVVDMTTGLPVFTRSALRANEVDPRFETLNGPIFDAAVKYLCPDAWSRVPA